MLLSNYTLLVTDMEYGLRQPSVKQCGISSFISNTGTALLKKGMGQIPQTEKMDCRFVGPEYVFISSLSCRLIITYVVRNT
jgi:hypothetical protein